MIIIQINYLIEESQSVGKGADTVISLVHNYFELYGLGEREIIIHADNWGMDNRKTHNVKITFLR